jgi:hypothetical protein
MATRTLKDIIKEKFGVHSNEIERGFFYFFGLTEHPSDKYLESLLKGNVNKSLKKDADSIAEDFRASYLYEVSKLDVEN